MEHLTQGKAYIVAFISGQSGLYRSCPWVYPVLPILVTLLFFSCLTYTFSALRFRYLLSVGHIKSPKVMPVVPYWLPGLYHVIPIVVAPTDFLAGLIKRFGWERPLQLKAGPTNCTLTANPFHIQEIFKSRFLSAKSITRISAKNLLDIPSDILSFYDADDSGMAAEPRKGSRTAQEDRILYHQTHSAQKYLAAPYLGPLTERYLRFFRESVDRQDIGDTWMDYPDLYAFLQQTVSRANIEAMMGSDILKVNPQLIEHFWQAKGNAPAYFRGWPRWLVPRAFKERDRVVDEIERWHAHGLANADVMQTGPHDPDWEPVLGSRYEKARLQYMLKMKPLTARVRASEDWGFMFGANGNTAPSAFWYLFEALKNPNLAAQLSAEVAACTLADGSINIEELGSQPLLQSTYAEVLRLRVSILVSRMVDFGDVKFSGYTIRRGELVFMPTDGVHFSEEAWARAGRLPNKSMREFDAERFLVESGGGRPEFSTDGLNGLWIPFGGGERMCPGRHLAKLEMILTYAHLFSNYDLELGSVDTKSVKCDMTFAPFGALPPNRKVPFRIRRKRQNDGGL